MAKEGKIVVSTFTSASSSELQVVYVHTNIKLEIIADKMLLMKSLSEKKIIDCVSAHLDKMKDQKQGVFCCGIVNPMSQQKTSSSIEYITLFAKSAYCSNYVYSVSIFKYVAEDDSFFNSLNSYLDNQGFRELLGVVRGVRAEQSILIMCKQISK